MDLFVRFRESAADRAVLLSLLLATIVFMVDALIPLGVASAVPYTFAILIGLHARSSRYVWILAILCMILTVVKVFLFPDRGSTELWKVVVNRCLALFVIGVTAFLGMKRRRAEERRRLAEEKIHLQLADLAHMGRLETAGQLAVGLAHELNQPLAAISLQSELAAQHVQIGAAQNREAIVASLREITEQSQRAGTILRSLRKMVHKADPQEAFLDLNELIHEVTPLVESQARRGGVVFQFHLAERLPLIFGDRIQLEQVLLNLLQNAIESTVAVNGSRRMVEVATGLDGSNAVQVAVRDTGVGLRPEDVECVFERFYTTKANGMGMGLAISRSIIEAHRGRIWAAPNADRGASFTFTLPLPSGLLK